MRKLKVIDETRLKVNPFLANLKIPATKVKDVGKYRYDLDKGAMVGSEYHMEKVEHTKVYHNSGNYAIIAALSPAGKCMYLYLLYRLERGKDWLQINKQHYMTKHRITSVNTYKKGLNELGEKGIISPSSAYPKDVFWINPNFFFNGNRLIAYPDNMDLNGEIAL